MTAKLISLGVIASCAAVFLRCRRAAPYRGNDAWRHLKVAEMFCGMSGNGYFCSFNKQHIL